SGLDVGRRGYRQMLEMIESDSVGGVFISEVSRAGRDDQAWLAFLQLLALHDVLLFENGIPTDPNDDDQVYVKKIQGLTVSRENKMVLPAFVWVRSLPLGAWWTVRRCLVSLTA